ncbi:MAG: hypothetical protein Q8P77_03535 [Candidatus Veblenbacteria bacterium]|nr:hypothetical protein [Candidatus Veblenbacteria bacterium]
MPQAHPTNASLELIARLEEAAREQAKTAEHPIHVSELTSLPAFAYEKLRNIVDYKEEHLLRKNAVRRFLKRKFLLPQFSQSPPQAAQALIRELILSRYLPNDSLPESLAEALGNVLGKYYALFDQVRSRGCDTPRWREQLLGLAAVECDSRLVSPAERNAYTAFAANLIRPALDLSAIGSGTDIQNVHLVLAIERVLNRADRDILNYYLLLHYYPDWFTLPSTQAGVYLAPHVGSLLNTFTDLNSGLASKRLMPIIRRLCVPLVIFRDALKLFEGSARDLLHNPQRLEQQMRTSYQAYWLATRRRIRRKGFHAMAYIFITKILIAILLELPYEKFILGNIAYLPLSINLIFPPVLMLVITLLIKSPTAQNEERVVESIREFVYDGPADFYAPQVLVIGRAKLWARVFYGLLYILTVGASFSAVVFLLWRLNFNLVSGTLFIFFASLVSFFGISLRQQARQLKVAQGRETITSFVLDFFTFPIVALGKWLSTTFDRYNFLIFLLDFLFEVPFKTLLKLIEDWFHFLKEKKEDML